MKVDKYIVEIPSDLDKEYRLLILNFAKAMAIKLCEKQNLLRRPDFSEKLNELVRISIYKGDPIDVANFCSFLWRRSGNIKGFKRNEFKEK